MRLRKPAFAAASLVSLVLALRFAPGHARPRPARLEIIAHRGVHQTYGPGAGRHGCTATRIHPPTHSYLENTIPSMAAAFDAGATMVEIDFHDTIDGDMVVFHDWTVDCRTEGTGVTPEQTLAYLKSLDVGWGYTADGGRTFPFRGKGGPMPTLREVLDRFPDRSFVLNQKSASRRGLEVLATILSEYPAEQRNRLHYWGAIPEVAHELIPDLGTPLHDRRGFKQCGTDYLLSLGLGALPARCRGTDIIIPRTWTVYVWGWPDRFLRKAEAGGSRVFVWTDDPREIRRVPADGIMTDKIEIVGPALAR